LYESDVQEGFLSVDDESDCEFCRPSDKVGTKPFTRGSMLPSSSAAAVSNNIRFTDTIMTVAFDRFMCFYLLYLF